MVAYLILTVVTLNKYKALTVIRKDKSSAAENSAAEVKFSTQFCGGRPLRMRNLRRMRIVQNALLSINWRREGRLGSG